MWVRLNNKNQPREEGKPAPVETKLPVSDSAPYPPVQVQGPSPLCARAMLSNIGSCNSEMTAIGQYIYNSSVMKERYPKVSEYFHKIAVAEMRHLDIFCELAMLLGTDPRLWSYVNNRVSYWSPVCIPYSRDLPVLLNRAVVGENKAISEYRRQIAELPDPHIKALLERIILDEEKHIVIFRRLYQEYCTEARS